MHKFFTAGLLACLGVVVSISAIAQEYDDDNAIVVTATRSAQTADETLASVSVISRADIENTQAESIVELLQHQAGIDILRSGGPAQQTSLFMRGTNSDHTLVLIDGMRVSSATTGAFQWENISLNEIERIEIVRGPRSALYGSEAIGGVIQIFTRKNPGADTKITQGSFATYGIETSAGFGERNQFHVNASHHQADGFSATNSNSYSFNADNDGYVSDSVGMGFDSRVSDALSIGVNGQYSATDSDFDTGRHESRQQRTNARMKLTPNSNTAVAFSVGLFDDELNTVGSSLISTARQSLGLQWDQAVGRTQILTLGADYRRDRGSNIDTFASTTVFDNTVDNAGVFIHWGNSGDQSLELSGRVDTHSQFGSHTTGQIAWGRKLGSSTRAYVSYGTGFKAADLNELYHPGFDYSAYIPGCNPCYAGNPSLRPERSSNIELGLKNTLGQQQIRSSIYFNRIDDLIDFQGTNYQAINVTKAVMYGLELGYRNKKGPWTLDSNLTLQRALDEATGQALLRRPNGKLSTRLIRRLPQRGSFMTEMLVSSGHADYGVDIPAYSVVNLAAIFPLAGRWSIEGRINNLMDNRYQVIWGYNTTPRSYLVSLHYRSQ